MEEQKNLLVSEDDLISEPIDNGVSNLENGYTEELDFSNLSNEMSNRSFNEQVVEPRAAVPLEPIYEENNNEVNTEVTPSTMESASSVVENNVEDSIDNSSIDKKINENPMGKIKFKTATEEVEEHIDPSTIKLDFKDNNNLKFVIALGLILLIAIFAIPFIITHRF